MGEWQGKGEGVACRGGVCALRQKGATGKLRQNVNKEALKVCKGKFEQGGAIGN